LRKDFLKVLSLWETSPVVKIVNRRLLYETFYPKGYGGVSSIDFRKLNGTISKGNQVHTCSLLCFFMKKLRIRESLKGYKAREKLRTNNLNID
jgi:hypothetical protein